MTNKIHICSALITAALDKELSNINYFTENCVTYSLSTLVKSSKNIFILDIFAAMIHHSTAKSTQRKSMTLSQVLRTRRDLSLMRTRTWSTTTSHPRKMSSLTLRATSTCRSNSLNILLTTLPLAARVMPNWPNRIRNRFQNQFRRSTSWLRSRSTRSRTRSCRWRRSRMTLRKTSGHRKS